MSHSLKTRAVLILLIVVAFQVPDAPSQEAVKAAPREQGTIIGTLHATVARVLHAVQ